MIQNARSIVRNVASYGHHPLLFGAGGFALGHAAMSGSWFAIIASCFLGAAWLEQRRKQRIEQALQDAVADKVPDENGKVGLTRDEVATAIRSVSPPPVSHRLLYAAALWFAFMAAYMVVTAILRH